MVVFSLPTLKQMNYNLIANSNVGTIYFSVDFFVICDDISGEFVSKLP